MPFPQQEKSAFTKTPRAAPLRVPRAKSPVREGNREWSRPLKTAAAFKSTAFHGRDAAELPLQISTRTHPPPPVTAGSGGESAGGERRLFMGIGCKGVWVIEFRRAALSAQRTYRQDLKSNPPLNITRTPRTVLQPSSAPR